MKMITVSALEELLKLQRRGFEIEKTQATDGSDIVVAKSIEGLVRIFKISDLEE